ncbi:hypothetical protein ACFWN1_16975 [Streptomyces sp. NPDC058459]|uniref:hypothetical protein n=1 Tax=Streptomyces sp. NPDC058459 TaxID=3346508 RepID=UPI0036590091
MTGPEAGRQERDDAPHFDRGHRTPDLWQPYEAVNAPPPPRPRPSPIHGTGGLRAVPAPDGAA